MVIDIMNVDKMVAVNNLKPVTSPLFFNSNGTPDPNGLFSYEIFGFPGSYERKNRPAYIQLDGYYLVPHVYKILISLNRKLSDLISGNAYFIFNKNTKSFEKVDGDVPGMGTGLDFLYEHWDEVVFAESESKKRSDRVDLVNSLKKEEAFMDKQYVIPAFLRDMSTAEMGTSEINGFYKKIIIAVNTINTMGKIGFTYNITRNSIQNTINEIYAYFTNLTRLKNGFLHKSVLSKNVDYCARTLITAPTYNADSWKDMPADYEHASVPLTQILSIFTLFIQAYIESWIENQIGSKTSLVIYDRLTKKVERKNLAPDWRDDYTREKIEKQIELFIHTPESRFYPVMIKFEDGSRKPFNFISGNQDVILEDGSVNDGDKIKNLRYLTWTDLFYIAADDVALDKHVIITRYPITNQNSEYFAGIKIRSTFKTCRMLVGNKIYNSYPVVDLSTPSEKIERAFIDSLEIFSPYLGPLGGDHDGDQVTIRGLFTKEANEFAHDHIRSLSNLVGVDGKTVREGGDVATHCMYNLLRDPDD